MGGFSTTRLVVDRRKATLAVGAALALLFRFPFDALRQKLVCRLGNRLDAGLGEPAIAGLLRRSNDKVALNRTSVLDLQELRGFVTSPFVTAPLYASWSLALVAIMFLFYLVLGVVAAAGLALLAAIAVLTNDKCAEARSLR